MKYSTVALAAFVAVASAQADISIIPECARPCIDDAVSKSSKCTATDFKCICSNVDEVVAGATTCVLQECGNAVALNEVLPATEKFCKAVLAGGDDTKTTTTSAAPASSAPATKSSAPASSKAPSSSEAPAETSSAPASEYPTASVTLTKSVVPTSSAASTTTTAAPSSTSPVTAGAASIAGSLGLLFLGAVAAL